MAVGVLTREHRPQKKHESGVVHGRKNDHVGARCAQRGVQDPAAKEQGYQNSGQRDQGGREDGTEPDVSPGDMGLRHEAIDEQQHQRRQKGKRERTQAAVGSRGWQPLAKPRDNEAGGGQDHQRQAGKKHQDETKKPLPDDHE